MHSVGGWDCPRGVALFRGVVYIYVYMYICMYIHVCVCVCVCVYMYMCVCMYLHDLCCEDMYEFTHSPCGDCHCCGVLK